ncbi:MAG: hypothetical protein KKA05_10315, partial [Alphaproteobacteria bacterium]|nr:hypothetical protein [Alphaproteobacteria bacterium]
QETTNMTNRNSQIAAAAAVLLETMERGPEGIWTVTAENKFFLQGECLDKISRLLEKPEGSGFVTDELVADVYTLYEAVCGTDEDGEHAIGELPSNISTALGDVIRHADPGGRFERQDSRFEEAVSMARTYADDGAYLTAADRLEAEASRLRQLQWGRMVAMGMRVSPPPLFIPTEVREVMKGAASLIEEAITTHIYDEQNGDVVPKDSPYVQIVEELQGLLSRAGGDRTARMVVVIDGGKVQSATTDSRAPVEIIVVDLDTEGMDRDAISMVRRLEADEWDRAVVTRYDMDGEDIVLESAPVVREATSTEFDFEFPD